MKIAFYAPMKPPLDDRPSGDRRMALLLIRALEAAGHEVFLASRFRTWEPRGDRSRQLRLQRIGARMANRLLDRMERSPRSRPDAWVTYHLYHRAPDWLGPAVASRLHIPYVVIEASHATKQMHGPWALGYHAATQAIRGADCVIALNSDDVAGIREIRRQRVVLMKPFLDLPATPTPLGRVHLKRNLALAHGLDPAAPWLIAVAMMREHSKLASYRLLAKSLERVLHTRWNLILIGGGPARAQVADAYAAFPSHRICFAGELDHNRVTAWLHASDLFVWPAVGEAYGMALLEAQACGLPAVAGRVGGVPDIVEHGETGLLVEHDAGAFAHAVHTMLTAPRVRTRMAVSARRKVEREHNITAATTTLQDLLSAEVARRIAPTNPAYPRGRFLHG